MPDHDSNELERGYALGYRAALNKTLRDVLRELGYDSDEASKARWVLEREQAVVQLRILCAGVGDNEWPPPCISPMSSKSIWLAKLWEELRRCAISRNKAR